MSRYQTTFLDMVMGTLIYAVVIGFYDDYTRFIDTTSYSTTFLAAFVLQILTFLTFAFKDIAVRPLKGREGAGYKVATGLTIWAIVFFSKFVFLAVLDYVFGDDIDIDNFVHLMVIIVTMTVAKAIFDLVYARLGQIGAGAATSP